MDSRQFFAVLFSSMLSFHSDAMDEKPKALFYHTPSGEMIMNPKTYNDGIKTLLTEENKFIVRQMLNRYDNLFEIGCGTCDRAVDITKLGGKFYGIDINPRFIEESNFLIKEKKIEEKASASNFSVNEITRENFPLFHGKTLIFFPFNLLGNLDDFHLVLETMIEIGQDFCFSTYRINDSVKTVRQNYYDNCGCQKLRYSTTPVGDLFSSSDGLHSAAFKIGYITDLIDSILEKHSKKASVSIDDLANIALMVHVYDIADQT